MSEQSFPVFIEVRRPDGTNDRVRVGTAVRIDDGFTLRLGELTIGSAADARAPSTKRTAPPPGGAVADGVIFPPYGRSKGQPVVGASMQDLEFYANGCRRTLNDPAKSRWHDKERVLLAAIESEIARQQGGGGGGEAPPDRDEPPPMTDDDIPF